MGSSICAPPIPSFTLWVVHLVMELLETPEKVRESVGAPVSQAEELAGQEKVDSAMLRKRYADAVAAGDEEFSAKRAMLEFQACSNRACHRRACLDCSGDWGKCGRSSEGGCQGVFCSRDCGLTHYTSSEPCQIRHGEEWMIYE